ncbi:ATP-binding protein [Hymenobacter jejuensis]|uniref:AAA family ATPase n=1 Tax=Hymenobacter jejuensis TaxID=2502781 RepID=A0A5B8A2Q1_9BACT|nr:ATP-binding protein [Hymenobacter jejuensis]QDA61588.1 AAA family ATPase [Hymenobacter jejuensis]
MTNTPNLSTAVRYLRAVLEGRLQVYTGQAKEVEINEIAYLKDESPFANFIVQHRPSFEEYVVLLLALIVHIRPHFFTQLIAEFLPEGGDLPEFGGVRLGNHRGILPTGETALFVLAGDDLEKRLEIQRLLGPEHWLSQKHVLRLETTREGEPTMSGLLMLDSEVVELLTTGTVSAPRFSIEFPAERLLTEMEWNDLVLLPGTQQQIQEIQNWITYSDTLLQDWGMRKQIKPGFRALFYGPPGTGKTLTASLLGKHTDKDVFRIDLSRVVSKYIGETEKNLAGLFDKAENKNWILFFDEADALFGKRTDIRDAHDKYANQEVAYLLQRIEGYNGLVILASNQRANIDEAFARRFQTIVHFPVPGAEERYRIWQKALPAQLEIAADIDWHQVAARYELTGAGILNVAHYCAIEALADRSCRLDLHRLKSGILREYSKEGKVI